MVPGSTLRYGSNFCNETLSPRLSIRQPMEAAANPLPSEDTTPPVTKMYFAAIPSSVVWICAPGIAAPCPPEKGEPPALSRQRNHSGACRGARSIMAGFCQRDKRNSKVTCEFLGTSAKHQSNCYRLPSILALADRKTSSNIVAVSFPVAVFWLE